MKPVNKAPKLGKTYAHPRLVRYGSIRALTKAGSGGRSEVETGDPGNPLKRS